MSVQFLSSGPCPELAHLLDLSGFVWKGVDHPSDVDNLEPEEAGASR